MQRLFVLRDSNHAKQLWAFLKMNWAACASSGKPLAVMVTEHKAKRSRDQNAKYWAMLSDLADNAWVGGRKYSKEQWHLHWAGELIGWEELPGGRQAPISTATLDVASFSEYIEKIMQRSADELGVILT